MNKLKTFLLFTVINLFCFMTYAQQTVRGNISDEYADAIIGASILQKGTTNGTVTDIDGNFSLSAPNGATL